MKWIALSLVFAVSLTCINGDAVKKDQKELLKKIKDNLNNEVMELMELGATTPRFSTKRTTPL